MDKEKVQVAFQGGCHLKDHNGMTLFSVMRNSDSYADGCDQFRMIGTHTH
ncbi:hypothetical protein ElyMa_006884500 [Elysia marginata]|uniref:Uncharacterized protein n=1 Tax=Elysia marginata TaxID=1093978 RepID=A0AAV4JAP9_9GAST|nr:hypothetical protein ElyMa_006884500 [Elysia marginata]